MKFTMNISTCSEDTLRYRDREDLRGFFRGHGLDGLEVLEAGPDEAGVILPEDVLGVHLRYWSGWMDLWTGNEARLLEEFQTRENWLAEYGGDTPEALVRAYEKNIRFANTLEPEYLVFHVSECTMAESMRRRDYFYTDEAVCDGAAALLNRVTDGIEGQPWLLLENLWYSGLTLERPELVARLLDRVNYEKTGVMLDTGHLMHRNRSLRTPDEAVDHIHRVLDRYEDLSFIRGIHLHQSLTGQLAETLMATWRKGTGTYQEQLWEVLGNIFRLDTHRPFCSHRIREIFDRLPGLEYVCLEQITATREENDRFLREQMGYLGGMHNA